MREKLFLICFFSITVTMMLFSAYCSIRLGMDSISLYHHVKNMSGQVTWDGVWVVFNYVQDVAGFILFALLTWNSGKTICMLIKEL